MSVAKVSEIIASSSKSFDDAVAAGIQRANKKLKKSGRRGSSRRRPSSRTARSRSIA